ncbi:MAG: trypsin-like peptidase domain-containing protein, partial [Pseudomonadales bacterium]|nr:trypsin-like peptidase domain-containing protein [Pseudomonadales bacterium]
MRKQTNNFDEAYVVKCYAGNLNRESRVTVMVVLLGLTVLIFGIIMPSRSWAAIPDQVAGEPLPSLAPILKQATPAVVNIATFTQVRRINPLLDDPFFRRFFNVPDRLFKQRNQTPERRPQSAGSGVIVRTESQNGGVVGYVLTNHHVIDQADDITVTLQDGQELSATLLGSDESVDIAVLRIQAQHLAVLPTTTSSSLEVGDFVVAIGNPFGLGQTVTSGIVSALGRSGLGIYGYEDFIQTDASINPGNSGGALINLRGELVGINSAIIAPAGGNVGIGFAIPTEIALNVLDQLIAYGEVRRGQLGLLFQDVTPKLAEAFQLTSVRGVLVTRVLTEMPA